MITRRSENAKVKRQREHMPTLAVSVFWMWIILFVFLCGCGILVISVLPIFPKQAAGPPRATLPSQSVDAETPEAGPTSAPTPTATAAPVTAKVIEDRVNLRAAPSTDADIVGKAGKDDQFTLLGRSQDGQWYQVTVAGKAELAWIFGDTLQIASGDPATLPVVKMP